MCSKIILIASALCVAAAQAQLGQGHGQGHAISSQSYVIHQSHETEHQPIHHQPQIALGHGHAHSSQNIVLHQTHDNQHQPIHQQYFQPAQVSLGHQEIQNHHQSHGHAQSSQNIVLHQSHGSNQATHGDHHEEEYYSHPKYEYSYSVEDKHTGDIKSQHEARDGDVVKGQYSLHEADGTIRIVEYTADKHNGFNAYVKREGHAKHIEPVHHH